jgi:hypothetical protein
MFFSLNAYNLMEKENGLVFHVSQVTIQVYEFSSISLDLQPGESVINKMHPISWRREMVSEVTIVPQFSSKYRHI